jgi:hypothetical protein
MGKTLLIEFKYLFVTATGAVISCTVEWIRVNMWCVNSHLTNKILVRVNTKLGHFNDQILSTKDSLKSITCMDIWDIWIKFLGLIIAIVAKLNIVVVLDYSNPIFG